VSEISHDEFTEYDGAYVLGALSDDDLVAFEEHLAGCINCRTRVDELSELPDLLSLLPAVAFTSSPPALDPVVPLLAAVRARRRRQRWITAGAATAAAACIIALTVVISGNPTTTKPAAQLAVPVAMTAVTAAPIHATAEVAQVAWGTSIRLRCTYDSGVSYPSDEQYSLIVQSRSGQTENVGTWTVVPGKVMTFPAGTAIRKADIKSITVDSVGGTPLLQLSY
jgi:anti-sigma factor RsiW